MICASTVMIEFRVPIIFSASEQVTVVIIGDGNLLARSNISGDCTVNIVTVRLYQLTCVVRQCHNAA